MTKKDIQTYIDPDDFETLGSSAKYPCSTERMKYNPLTHKYYLTAEALLSIGVDPEMHYMSNSPNKTEEFIEEVSEDVYGAIMHLAPFNFQYHCAQIAMARSFQFRDKYSARKQFEKALLYQAKYKSQNADVREINGVDIEGGNTVQYETLRKELRHLSPKTLDILQILGLLFNGNIPGKHLIAYDKVM